MSLWITNDCINQVEYKSAKLLRKYTQDMGTNLVHAIQQQTAFKKIQFTRTNTVSDGLLNKSLNWRVTLYLVWGWTQKFMHRRKTEKNHQSHLFDGWQKKSNMEKTVAIYHEAH